MSKKILSKSFFVLALLASILLSGCDVISVFRAESSPELLQQTIEAIATRYTPDAPEGTPLPVATLAPSYTVTPTFALSPTVEVVDCRETLGQIDYREIIIPDSSVPLAFRVYLPPCYEVEDKLNYPVLYLLHSQNQKDDQWERLGVDEAADRLISSGDVPPFIIVMPWELNSMQDDKLSNFEALLIENLIPWVDAEYRTCALRDCRSIGGIGRGGGWAVRLGLIHWQLFGSLGAHSYNAFPGDFNNAPYWFKDVEDEQYPRIYMDMGAIDAMLPTAAMFEERLTKYLVPHEWIINSGTHNDAYWSAHVDEYLYWYAFPWKSLYYGPEFGFMTPTPGIDSTNEEAEN